MNNETYDFTLIKHNLPNGAVIYPVADVHFGALEHREQEWTNFVKMVQNTPNAYLVLNGDLVNNSIRSSVANPFDEVCRPREQKARMVGFLEPIADRVLCVTSGNHEMRTSKESDQDITYDICAKLNLEDIYRPNMAFMKISVGTRPTQRNNRDQAECTYGFCVTHGSGGGIYTGATVNRNERFGNIIDGLDCLIVGHSHKGAITRPQKIIMDLRNDKVILGSYTMISCESWMVYGGYAARKMLLPTESGVPQRIYLNGVHGHKQLEVRW